MHVSMKHVHKRLDVGSDVMPEADRARIKQRLVEETGLQGASNKAGGCGL